jgi:hypothetical protein
MEADDAVKSRYGNPPRFRHLEDGDVSKEKKREVHSCSRDAE